MRCKNHCTDLSSITGVCASCLRERLFTIILSQEQISHPQSTDNIPTVDRSVSSYITHRKTVNNSFTTVKHPYNNRLNHSTSEKRFHNSPQIAITTGGCIGTTSSSSSNGKKPNFVRFPSISNLFRSNSNRNNNRNSNSNSNSNGNENTDTNHRVSISSSYAPSGAGGRPSSVTPSPSWFSNVLPTVSNGVVRKEQHQRCVSDRGMSPVRTFDDGDGDSYSYSYSYSDGSSANESTESCKQTPLKTPLRNRGQKSVTEMIFCPLVNVKGKLPVDVRGAVVPHISYVKSFSGNRSRKIADFGRCDPNR